MSTIKELQKRAFQQSTDKGFHDNEPEVGTPYWIEHDSMKIALMHSELTEALEELRNGRHPSLTYYSGGTEYPTAIQLIDGTPLDGKPEGVPSELADVVIRVMDYCEARGIDLQASIIEKLDYNATRSRMHGGKKF